MSADKDFVTFLVDETLRLQNRGEMKLSSLELKLNDYELHYLKGEYLPQLQMLRFSSSVGPLDIPSNWSFFSTEVDSDFVLLDEMNDRDNFFSVIKSIWHETVEKILVIHADGFCYIVGMLAGEETHLHDLINPQEWLKSA